MIKAVIFDVDGTLIDSVDHHARAWCDAFADYGYEIPFEKMRAQIGKGADQLMPVFLDKEEMKTVAPKLEKHRAALFKKKYLPSIRAFPKVRELFETILEEGLQIALASSANGDELSAYKEKAHITDLVETETSKDDAEKSKPHPDIFEAALAELDDVEESEVLVIGDTPYDAEAAKRAGISIIGVRCGGFPEQNLRDAGCIAIHDDPADLLIHFREWIERA